MVVAPLGRLGRGQLQHPAPELHDLTRGLRGGHHVHGWDGTTVRVRQPEQRLG